MKKKLEAELISIAHRILKLKNKSDIIQLHQETQKLYEKLSILRFVEENMGDVRPTIGRTEVEELIESSFDENEPEMLEPHVEAQPEPEIPQAPEVINELAAEKEPEQVIAEAEEETIEESESDQDQEPEPVEIEEPVDDESSQNVESQPEEDKKEEPIVPAFEWVFEPKESQTKPEDEERSEVKEALAQAEIAFEDLLGPGYVDPVFVKSDEAQKTEEEPLKNVIPITRPGDKVQVIKMNNSEIADRAVSLNDRLSKGITVGLNDRIAFVKHLFNNSNEDYNRVLSQLITFSTFDEAKEFIDNMVKPDYNNWEGKNEYAERFMEVVEKKFT